MSGNPKVPKEMNPRKVKTLNPLRPLINVILVVFNSKSFSMNTIIFGLRHPVNRHKCYLWISLSHKEIWRIKNDNQSNSKPGQCKIKQVQSYEKCWFHHSLLSQYQINRHKSKTVDFIITVLVTTGSYRILVIYVIFSKLLK